MKPIVIYLFLFTIIYNITMEILLMKNIINHVFRDILNILLIVISFVCFKIFAFKDIDNERELYIIYIVFLAVLIILIVTLTYHIYKNKRSQDNNEED